MRTGIDLIKMIMRTPSIRPRAFICAGGMVSLLIPFISFAQLQSPPSIQWAKCFGGSLADGAFYIQNIKDSSYIIAGYSLSNDGNVTNHHGPTILSNFDSWILKINYNGIIQWENSYGGSQEDVAHAIQQTNDGGFIVAGSSNSNDFNVTGHHGDSLTSDYWIVKLDSMGNIQWEKSLGGSNQDVAWAIKQTNDNGYIIAGSSCSTDGDVTGNNDGGCHIWVVKLDSIGNIQWKKIYGGSKDNQAYDIQQTKDGGYIVAGFTESNDGDVTGYHGGMNDYWIVKLNDTGKIEWEKCYGGSNDDYANSIQQTNDYGYIIAGASNSVDSDVTGNHGGYDYWIVKIDSLGNIQWEKSYGGSDEDVAQSIQQTSDGGYIVGGYTLSNDGDITTYYGGLGDYWMLKIDSIGNIQWQKSLGGSNTDGGPYGAGGNICIQQCNNNYLIIGTSLSNNDEVTGNHGNGDIWLVKLIFPPMISSLRQQTILPLICESAMYDTLWVHNTGTLSLLLNSANFIGNNQNYFIISPSFPDSIAGGDSIRFIVRFTATIVDSFPTILNIYSNDSSHSPWQINISGTKTDIGIALLNLKDDTLNFGDMDCSTSKDSAFNLLNTSSIATGFLLQIASVSFSSLPYVFIDSGINHQINIHFTGGMPGNYFDSIVIIDTCGKTKTVYLAATVLPISAPIITALGATTFCAVDSITLNAPNGFNSYIWSDGETSQNIIVKKSGAYTVTVTNANGCTATSAPDTVMVMPLPRIFIFTPASVSICPYVSDTIPLAVTNNDTASEF